MNLAYAIPLGLASAVAYGVAAAVQHEAVGQAADGAAAPTLRELLRDGRWWASIAGDSFGLVLQLAALATGPVVLIQPLFILCLPVALPIRAVFGGAGPSRGDYLATVALALGLGGFFAIAGNPGASSALAESTSIGLAVIALAGGLAVAAAAGRLPNAAKAVVLSAVSGLWFGVEAVFVNSVATSFDRYSWSAFERADTVIPVVAATVIGLSGFALSQVAFRAGNLAASFPAMLVLDPLVAVLLGAALLGEHVRITPAADVGYSVCLVVIVLATVRLARPVHDELVPRLT